MSDTPGSIGQPPPEPTLLGVEEMGFSIQGAPRWFFVVAAAIYATGFLIIFTFFRFELGISSAGAEFFKVQYIYVGSLFLIMSAILIAPIVVLSLQKQTRNLQDSNGDLVAITLPTVLMVFVLLFSFYIFAMFAPPGFGSRPSNWIWIILEFMITVFGALSIQYIQNYLARWGLNREKSLNIYNIMNYVLFFLVLAIAVYLFYDIFDTLATVIWPGGAFFSGFLVLEYIVIKRIVHRHLQLSDSLIRLKLWTTGLTVFGVIYFLRVLVFATLIFPYIPFEKGGGYYKYSKSVVMVAASNSREMFYEPMIAGQANDVIWTVPLKLVHETDKSYFVADPAQKEGPEKWGGFRAQPPEILEISRTAILSVKYTNGAKK